MIFNSIAFLVFAPLFYAAYFLSSGQLRLLLCLVASYFFYAWWDWRFLSLILLSTAIDYSIGLAMERASTQRGRRGLLTASVVANLGILGTFKYFDFFSESLQLSLNSIGLDISTPLLNLTLPIGISFYTFQTLSYTVDRYRGEIPAERSLLRFATFVALFPQLVAGPIVRASKLLPQLRQSLPFDAAGAARGLELIAWGFFLKLCLADTAAQVVDARFLRPDLFESGSLVLGVVCFALQIYGDFAGYSLIAIGLGRIMGYDFGINFRRPYFAVNFSDFWRRWHISLSEWIRDYLYKPLGGSRGSSLFTMRNLMITMVIGGLWHGASITFVVWGLLHGLYLVGQRLVGPPFAAVARFLSMPSWLANVIRIFVVFSLTCFAWVFFRAASMGDAYEYLAEIATFDGLGLSSDWQMIPIVKTFIFAMIAFGVDLAAERESIRQRFMSSVRLRVLAVCALIWLISIGGVFEGASFIYFQF